MHVKHEGTKHKIRDFYLVVSIDHGNNTAELQKFCGSSLREKRYLVKLNQIYLASANFVSYHNVSGENDEDDGVELNNEILNMEEDNDQYTGDISDNSLIRPSRMRRPPEWLATKEIQRSDWPT